ncbi:hypothetical protein [Gordonibacter massiliensis (ex Traore et al. 2017)]|uniref:hypothetical protein n=1 Tax=Gordonibacter massiliensis (ex Traore et al. 2017) TaxID=1841863 RepID=UPI001C8CD955|nr:hypothetical protein [Gordonibacter massiliensis (ex Traore et al. 2017)]MBX9032715.1 hypothetical protein [Gordonibacter massiliensis (ex Traore et al. 2017)]
MATKRKSVKNAKRVAGSTGPVTSRPAVETGEAKAKPATASGGPGGAKEKAPAAKGRDEAKAKSVPTEKKSAAKPKPSVASARKVAIPPAAPPAASTPAASSQAKKAAKKDREVEKRTAAAPGSPEAPEGSSENAPRAEKPRGRKTAKRRWPWYVALGVVAVLIVAAAAFSWDRWLRYDDARELQGEWQVADTTRVVVVNGESIKLTDDVAYSYAIDPAAKTIEFTFGNMEGKGRYRFSADRSQLVITEGDAYSTASTLFEDLGWMWDGFVRSVQGQEPVQPKAGDGTTVLVRVSHDAEAQPRDVPELAAGAAAQDDASKADAASTGDGSPSGEAAKTEEPEGPQGEASEHTDAADEPVGSGDASGTADSGSSGQAGSGSSSPGDLFDVSDIGA